MNVSDDRVRKIRETYFRGTSVVGRAELVAICDELLHLRSAPDAPEKPPGADALRTLRAWVDGERLKARTHTETLGDPLADEFWVGAEDAFYDTVQAIDRMLKGGNP